MITKAIHPSRIKHLRKSLEDPEASHPSRFRYKSETLCLSTRIPSLVAPTLRHAAAKSHTNPPSRTNTPPKLQTIKSAKQPAVSLEKLVKTEQCLSSILEVRPIQGMKTGMGVHAAVNTYRSWMDSKGDLIVGFT